MPQEDQTDVWNFTPTKVQTFRKTDFPGWRSGLPAPAAPIPALTPADYRAAVPMAEMTSAARGRLEAQ